MILPLRYAFLALLATAVNILCQDLSIRLYQGTGAVALATLAGTGVGLVFKYVLDKRYIFHFRATNAAHDGRTFALYLVMGLATTALFWGVEFGFDHLFGNKTMRYVGAALGLAIGYLAKYHLDKRFVFRSAA